MEEATFSKRLKKAMIIRGYSQTDLSNRTNIDRGAISSYLSGRYKPKDDRIKILAKALHVSPSWLSGYGPEEYMETPLMGKLKDEELYLPFITQKLSAGTGEDWMSDVNFRMKSIPFIALMTRHVDKSSLVVAEVRGDSMTGAGIYPGDYVVFSKGLISGEGIYVIAMAGDVYVKRIAFDPIENKLTIISENPKYEKKVVDAEDVLLLGKVVGWVHAEV